MDMVFRSVGYRGTPLPDVPFYERWGIIPNRRGRVLTRHEGKQVVRGAYAAGWIKRGPTGVIGTNKPDAIETAECFLEDLRANAVLQPADPGREAVHAMIAARKPNFTTFGDWETLDKIERQRGAKLGRRRVKLTTVGEMLEALGKTPGSAGGD